MTSYPGVLVPRVHSFPPIARSDATVLILGSMPGVASLEAARYYAHPRNAFWDVMDALVGASRDVPYETRLEHLQNAGIAVWDVLRSAEREGSLDSAILNPVPNDLLGLLETCPHIGLIATNGSFASSAFKRLAWVELRMARAGLRWVALPSTSPANARMTLERKIAVWREALESAVVQGRVKR
ncbi:MAG: DNA-deoxyinosine glycosylase [Pleurocapsa sp. SU_196_0]|nr:DNA-deoxyinosine glycosylase [Pleurocapsa sp. SU_196_0]